MDTICMDLTSDARFAKVGGTSIKTPFGDVFNGLDRDTGNEVMWRVVKTHGINPIILNEWLQELKQTTKLECKHLLKNLLCEKRSDQELIFISETISRGSLAAYLMIFKYPKLSVCQTWFKQILEGLKYLHARNITHGHLSCDHIYINSNTGELKIGDLCLVKLPEVTEGRFVFNSPVDDVRCFGLVVLEVAFAQLLPPPKLKKVMERLHESPFNKKYAAKLAKHIVDPDYRSLVEICIYASSSTAIANLLAHKFFTTVRDKNETLRSIIQKNTKDDKNGLKSHFDLIVTKNTLKDVSANNSHMIDMQITIVNRETVSKLKFRYDMNDDTPESLAQEIREALPFPEEYILAVKIQIHSALKNYISSLSKSIRRCCRTKDGPLSERCTKQQQCPSMSGSISPIDTSSATSVFMNGAALEHLSAIYGSMASAAVKGAAGREETLQPEVLYSDVQVTPRDGFEEDKTVINAKKM
eukprot:TRINITY_DN4217_c0_g1_i10.p1 TRINITY_DN4217_c0_g1~~TRINITY_DN4217_c0_g1_i10.p1  ORF type:complete len:471 (+),score=115.17 TRINITY_DN4217_c0_g1_i10:148-1560(+)